MSIRGAPPPLAALVDHHVRWGNALGIDPRRVTWRRALDMNDRLLRPIVTCGEIMTMPGLPRVPAANGISLTPAGLITGLF